MDLSNDSLDLISLNYAIGMYSWVLYQNSADAVHVGVFDKTMVTASGRAIQNLLVMDILLRHSWALTSNPPHDTRKLNSHGAFYLSNFSSSFCLVYQL